jgi:uncharacterized protein YjbI with pentapeptide repeats
VDPETRQQPGEEPWEERRQKTRWNKLWDWTEFGEKTAWDWMQLLIIPVVLAAGAFWFNSAQNAQQRETENRRAQAQVDVQEQSAQDAALQAYLDEMGTLLIDKGLLSSKEGDEVRTLARTRTLAVLRRVDVARKRSVMLFLAETGLASSTSHNAKNVGSNTGGEVGSNAQQIVILAEAELSGVDLRAIDLPQAHLAVANLSGADWSNSDLVQVELAGANLSGAYLSKTKLTGANMPNTDLSNTDLREADLSNANLSGADLSDADLSGADLTDAEGVTNEELEEQAKSLEDTIMPDGTKHD